MSQFWANMASSGDPNTWSGITAPKWVPPSVSAADSPVEAVRRQLQPGTRPAADLFWWMEKGRTCDVGEPKGAPCGAGSGGDPGAQIKACKAACMAEPTCGGFTFDYESKGTHGVWVSFLRGLECLKSTKYTGTIRCLYALFRAFIPSIHFRTFTIVNGHAHCLWACCQRSALLF
eukprot:SAG11_NODE_755_length_7329_cov_6.741355_5_plen_175_part_00